MMILINFLRLSLLYFFVVFQALWHERRKSPLPLQASSRRGLGQPVEEFKPRVPRLRGGRSSAKRCSVIKSSAHSCPAAPAGCQQRQKALSISSDCFDITCYTSWRRCLKWATNRRWRYISVRRSTEPKYFNMTWSVLSDHINLSNIDIGSIYNIMYYYIISVCLTSQILLLVWASSQSLYSMKHRQALCSV